MKKIIDFTGSLRFAVSLFICIAVFSGIGTFFRQNLTKEQSIEQLKSYFGGSAESVYNTLNALGLADFYYSPWFNLLLVLLFINLLTCSVQKLKPTWKMLNTKISMDPQSFSKYEIKTFEKGAENISESKLNSLFSFQWKKYTSGTGDETVYAFEKGRISRSGAIITHTGLLLLLVGAFGGSIFGYTGNIPIIEGTTSAKLELRGGESRELPFEIYVDDFSFELYAGTEKKSSYRSDITFKKDGEETKAAIEVNKPVKYDGHTLYQSGFGIFINKDMLFTLSAESTTGEKEEKKIKFGEGINIPNTPLSAKIIDFAPALSVDPQGNLINFKNSLENPALLLGLYEGETEVGRQWVLKNSPESGEFNEFTLRFSDVYGAEYTVISVKKAPGLFVVYAGFLIVSLGVIIAFYSRHHRFWVVTGKDSVSVYYNKNKSSGFTDRNLEKTVKSIETIAAGGEK